MESSDMIEEVGVGFDRQITMFSVNRLLDWLK